MPEPDDPPIQFACDVSGCTRIADGHGHSTMPPYEIVEPPFNPRRIFDALTRIEAKLDARATTCEPGFHQWNWMGGGSTFCRRCGLETHP